ncbi:MAG: ubiquitin carboxyl-terminal hydrolase family protein [Rickettsiales bacterium]|nr:ubiquitin carboxyl-terminal hydrolase family protein [Rickettsiales bacterium]
MAETNLKELLKQTREAKTEKEKTEISLQIKNAVAPEFKKGQQQDAEEFLNKFFDDFYTAEDSPFVQITQNISVTEFEGSKIENPEISAPVKILPISPLKDGSVGSSIKEITKDENLKNIKFLESEITADATRKTNIKVKPGENEFCIQVKRFGFSQENSASKIEDELTADEISLETTENKVITAQPTAFIVHEGTTVESGHYVAYIKEENNGKVSWWKYDDQNPAKRISVTDNQALNAARFAYLIKYSTPGTKLPAQQFGANNSQDGETNLCWLNSSVAFLNSFTSQYQEREKEKALAESINNLISRIRNAKNFDELNKIIYELGNLIRETGNIEYSKQIDEIKGLVIGKELELSMLRAAEANQEQKTATILNKSADSKKEEYDSAKNDGPIKALVDSIIEKAEEIFELEKRVFEETKKYFEGILLKTGKENELSFTGYNSVKATYKGLGYEYDEDGKIKYDEQGNVKLVPVEIENQELGFVTYDKKAKSLEESEFLGDINNRDFFSDEGKILENESFFSIANIDKNSTPEQLKSAFDKLEQNYFGAANFEQDISKNAEIWQKTENAYIRDYFLAATKQFGEISVEKSTNTFDEENPFDEDLTEEARSDFNQQVSKEYRRLMKKFSSGASADAEKLALVNEAYNKYKEETSKNLEEEKIKEVLKVSQQTQKFDIDNFVENQLGKEQEIQSMPPEVLDRINIDQTRSKKFQEVAQIFGKDSLLSDKEKTDWLQKFLLDEELKDIATKDSSSQLFCEIVSKTLERQKPDEVTEEDFQKEKLDFLTKVVKSFGYLKDENLVKDINGAPDKSWEAYRISEASNSIYTDPFFKEILEDAVKKAAENKDLDKNSADLSLDKDQKSEEETEENLKNAKNKNNLADKVNFRNAGILTGGVVGTVTLATLFPPTIIITLPLLFYAASKLEVIKNNPQKDKSDDADFLDEKYEGLSQATSQWLKNYQQQQKNQEEINKTKKVENEKTNQTNQNNSDKTINSSLNDEQKKELEDAMKSLKEAGTQADSEEDEKTNKALGEIKKENNGSTITH